MLHRCDAKHNHLHLSGISIKAFNCGLEWEEGEQSLSLRKAESKRKIQNTLTLPLLSLKESSESFGSVKLLAQSDNIPGIFAVHVP